MTQQPYGPLVMSRKRFRNLLDLVLVGILLALAVGYAYMAVTSQPTRITDTTTVNLSFSETVTSTSTQTESTTTTTTSITTSTTTSCPYSCFPVAYPIITVYPTTVAHGSAVFVTGFGFTPYGSVQVCVAQFCTPVNANSQGQFTVQITIIPAIPSGPEIVTALDNASGRLSNQATIQVT